ncbi:MAG: hypothetical protein AAF349_09935 [Cyanobacteria bacterium P01_A01_bin.68]
MKNFTITLYAFHLRHTLVNTPDNLDSSDEVASQKASILWEDLVELGENYLPFDGLKNLRSNLVCYKDDEYNSKLEQALPSDWLTANGTLDLGSICTENLQIEAELNPFLLNDTYAADLTLFPELPNTSTDVSQVKEFKPRFLMPSTIRASLGQTLWIYGEVDENENCQELADKYVKALLSGTNLKPSLPKQGELFGSPLFEYQTKDIKEPYNSTKGCHILIYINNNNHKSKTLKLLDKAYYSLLNLLCCYHKILYIYQEACQRKPEARRIYSKLNSQALECLSKSAKFDLELDKMESWLQELPLDAIRYNICLRDLNTHYISIKTNIVNYRTCLHEITYTGESDAPNFWKFFLRNTCKQWKEQIEIDIDYITSGEDLFEQMIDSVRGLVEIEEAKRDRSLERTVQVGATAMGGGAIVSGIVAEHAKDAIKPPIFKNSSNPITISLVWSFIATIGFGSFALIWWFLWQRLVAPLWKKSKSSNSKNHPKSE